MQNLPVLPMVFSGKQYSENFLYAPKKERTSKGSAGPFIKVRRKGSVGPQYENGIRGNAVFDSVDLFRSRSEIRQEV